MARFGAQLGRTRATPLGIGDAAKCARDRGALTDPIGSLRPLNVAYRESQVIQRDIQSRPEPSESFDGRAI